MFDPQQLTQALNEDTSFQTAFAKDPKQALDQKGLKVTDETATLLARQVDIVFDNRDDDVLGCTRL
ncbi:MAG: hypothetical protein AAF629_15345 [Chloroflexota bacterium]